MYRGGLPRTRIAEVTGAPASNVGYHLAVARVGDPGLEASREEVVGREDAPGPRARSGAGAGATLPPLPLMSAFHLNGKRGSR